MGRPPQPAGLRELKGARTRRHHKDVVPESDRPDTLPPVERDAPLPADLQPGEAKFWKYYAPLLAGAKMLTPADEQTLIDYCRSSYWVETCTKKLRAEWRKKFPDVARVKMLDAQARGWMDKKTTLAMHLGLTAIARTKTAWSGHGQVIDPVTRPTSKIAELQARSRALRRPVEIEVKPDA